MLNWVSSPFTLHRHLMLQIWCLAINTEYGVCNLACWLLLYNAFIVIYYYYYLPWLLFLSSYVGNLSGKKGALSIGIVLHGFHPYSLPYPSSVVINIF